MFEKLLGNDAVKEQLTKMVDNNAIGQSLLFAGPEGIGKSLFALNLANTLLEVTTGRQHPDLHIYRPEGKIGMHSIESMRRFTEEVYLSPLEAKRKIFIIHDADRMLTYSANALLKTFEEPALDSIIILLSSSPDKLLPTIRSRCRIIRFAPIPKEQIAAHLEKQGLDAEEAQRHAHLANGSLNRALKKTNPLRDQVLDILSQPKWQTWNELSQSVAAMTKGIEEEQKDIRLNLTAEEAEMTAIQKQAMEKEIHGTLTMRLIHHTNTIFYAILGWFRDLELIHVQGDPDLYMHIDRQDDLLQSYQRGERLPLVTVEKAIREARTSLDRATPLASILENLFLKLERI